ncbi:MAG: tyrosine-type recombinase/integrase [Campylobacterales bacterium]|nr:tyrosine-type recombinase/integrase [Campylobacterales bacterium]
MNKYIKTTKGGTYTYIRKIPTNLQQYINKSILKVALSKDIQEAQSKADVISNNINKALNTLKLSLTDEVKEQAVMDIVTPYVSTKILHTNKTAVEVTKPLTLDEVIQGYLSSLNVTQQRLQEYSTILNTISHIVNGNREISKITYKDIDNCKSSLIKLPKRNIQKYRLMGLDELLSCTTILDDERISNKTVNEYLKQLKALFVYAHNRGLVVSNITSSLKLLPLKKAREQKSPISSQELSLLLNTYSDCEYIYLIKALAYSGLRPSELLKCEVTNIDGVLCFDLTSPTLQLKTLSSYRVVPVHSSLIDGLDNLPVLTAKYSSQYLSKVTKKYIDKTLDNTATKSLYSLRHTFATELIHRGASSSIVSELMGHTHSSMTLSRYANGYSIKQLQEVVELLN